MSTNRSAHFYGTITRQLNEALPSGGPYDRLAWLVEFLKRHLTRYVGIGQHSSIPLQRLAQTDLYAILLGTGEVIYEEFRSIPDGPLFGQWDALMLRILNDPNREDRGDTDPLLEATAAFHALVEAKRAV